MGFGFRSIGHFFAVVASDLVKTGRVASTIEQKVVSQAPLVEGVTALIAPQFVDVERGAFAVLGLVAHAVTDAGSAAGASGLNLQLDAQTVNDIRALIPALEQFAAQTGLVKPPAPKP